ncbi:hypothetical protein [Pelagerythrobacter rhizovicinus]|uniref:Uncharacterized protein n=1 Tax=Pelagerythrobacter rhizovicinus TaxID=2268576 RepID=A0A4Q2KLF7_9SPHN|nr:hypothetical protein [Pelagerythrobacter rhizovicinus]RXZ66145.1 hypothetical protein ETX26_05385 [Pelagerythrobacter rhizovicinus]
MTEPLLEQWAADAADARFTRSEELIRQRTRFERTVRRRNLIEYAAGGVTIPVFAWAGWLTARAGEAVLTLGWALGIVGMVVVLTSLYYRASNLPHRPESDCRSHLRAQLEHQRQALASVPRWYLGPLVPGAVLVLIGSMLPIAREAGWGIALAGMAVPAAVVAAIFIGIAWLNRRAARMLECEIAALDALA